MPERESYYGRPPNDPKRGPMVRISVSVYRDQVDYWRTLAPSGKPSEGARILTDKAMKRERKAK